MTKLFRRRVGKVIAAPVTMHGRRVDFVIAGTQKGGTSALNAYLRGHPEVCTAETKKEVHFFDAENLPGPRQLWYPLYHSYFAPKPAHRVVGESTPLYMYWWHAPRRIWEYNPKMKVVVLLRNPIDRAYAHWNMIRSRGGDDMPFWQALQEEDSRCRTALPHQHRTFSYVDRGFYVQQLRRLWHFFGPRQTLILRSTDLRRNPDAVLKTVTDFLGVAPFDRVEVKTVHSRRYPAPMASRERDYLRGIFENEIKMLERLLDWDCSSWLD